MIHIKNLEHKLIMHFNKFDLFIQERDKFLMEVGRYLQKQLNPATYHSWRVGMGDCNNATLHLMLALMTLVHSLQRSLIRTPLLKIVSKDMSSDELAHHLFFMRNEEATIRIDQNEYGKTLALINTCSDEYSKKWADATQRLHAKMVYHKEEVRQPRKVHQGFLCLRGAMLDPGNHATLKSVSPDNFPLPDIAKIREQWLALDG